MGIIINGQNDTIGPVDNTMSLLGTVSIGGTMTIEDFTNIDSVGLVTARNGVNVTAGDINLTSGNLALASATPMVVASNGSGHLRLGAGGSEKVRIESGGFVGIGTENPNYLLDVYKSTGTNQDVFSVRGQTSAFLVQCSDLSAANPTWNLRSFAAEDITIKPGNSESVRFKADGLVGIGTDDPGAKTHIDSTTSNTPLVVEASQNNRSRIVFRNNVETGTECNIELFNDDLRFVTNSGERLRIASNGKVGIDNTTPHRQLVVGDGGDISCFGLNGGIYFGTSTGGFRNNGAVARAQQAGYHVSTSQVGDLVMAPEADKALIFSSGSTNTMYERLRVTTGGQLLISGEAALTSTSLSHPLQVAAGSNADGIAIIGRASDDISELSFYEADKTTNLGEIQYRQDHVNFRHRVGHISFATGGVSERIRIKSNGVVQVANAAHGSDNGDRLLEVIGSGNSQAGFLIANNATSASGTCDITFAPSNKIAGAQIFCEAQEDFSTGVNRTADLTFITRKDGTLSEKVRITSSGITQQKDLSGNYHVIASSRDGSTSARAATSAWEIKKTLGPDAKTGYYYLTNPYDSTTQQWWCDMETDGGGWILVAYNGDGQMASNPGNWYDRNNKGGFNGLTQGFYRGGGYWNTWGDLKGQLMWECRTLDTYFNSSSCSKVGINWGKNNNLPTAGTRAYSNITGNANTLFENWCWDIYNAPGFEPSNYEQHARNNRIGGANYFTEHMVITWSFRGTSGSADDGSNGPYWMIGAHHDGLHQHYEESLSGGDGANGDGGYQVCSNEDTSWGGGGQQHSMNRLGRHNQDGGSVFVWMR